MLLAGSTLHVCVCVGAQYTLLTSTLNRHQCHVYLHQSAHKPKSTRHAVYRKLSEELVKQSSMTHAVLMLSL